MTVPTALAPKHLIVLDWETYYSKDFSLSKLTTEEYIRSPEFEVIGVSVKLDDEPAVWCTGDDLDIFAFLQKFPWDKSLAVAHNAMFDMAILSWKYGIKPLALGDTLSMARALHGSELSMSLKALAEHYKLQAKGEEVVAAMGMRRADFSPHGLKTYGAYCINDTEITRHLFDLMSKGFRVPFGDDIKQLNRPGFPRSEMRLIDQTLRMFTEPVLGLDKDVLVPHLEAVKEKKALLMDAIYVHREDLMSNPKFAESLRELGVEPPMKVSAATGKNTYAFSKSDSAFTDLLEHPDLHVQALVAARLGIRSTLEETRTERFIAMADRGLMPVPLRYYGAHTGRWSGSDKINLQNITRGSPLNTAITAPEGHVIINCDSSQIEARVLAWLAGQEDLVDAFDRGDDVYKLMASSIYGKPVEEIDKDERFLGKTVVLGAGYGTGWLTFQKQLKLKGVTVTDDTAQSIIQTYREAYPRIPLLWKEAGNALDAILDDDKTAPLGTEGALVVEGDKGVRLPNGLYIRYPNLRWENTKGRVEMVYDTKRGRSTIMTRIHGPKMVENVTQALARIIIGDQLLMVARRYRVALTVHDSIVAIAPASEEAKAVEYITGCMKVRPKWAPTLPLSCEAKTGVNYG
jgi:DNA polymerase